MSGNKLRDPPVEISALRELESMDLSQNQLLAAPDCSRLQCLTTVNLRSVPVLCCAAVALVTTDRLRRVVATKLPYSPHLCASYPCWHTLISMAIELLRSQVVSGI
jgi:hypothetical protein